MKKRSSFLSTMPLDALDKAHEKNVNMAQVLKAEKHKPKKDAVIPDEYISDLYKPVKLYDPLHKPCKIAAATDDKDIQQLVNEMVYEGLVKRGYIPSAKAQRAKNAQ